MTSTSSTSLPTKPISVLFVCLGNICRSPLAEAVFAHITASLPPTHLPPISTDSAGTGAYHTGSQPDSRTLATLRKHGITDYRHAARQVKGGDFKRFDYVFAMDAENLRDLKRRDKGEGEGRVSLFGDWDLDADGNGNGQEIEDPYYGGDEGFEIAYQQCVRFSRGWVKRVLDIDVDVDSEGKVTIKKIDE